MRIASKRVSFLLKRELTPFYFSERHLPWFFKSKQACLGQLNVSAHGARAWTGWFSLFTRLLQNAPARTRALLGAAAGQHGLRWPQVEGEGWARWFNSPGRGLLREKLNGLARGCGWRFVQLPVSRIYFLPASAPAAPLSLLALYDLGFFFPVARLPILRSRPRPWRSPFTRHATAPIQAKPQKIAAGRRALTASRTPSYRYPAVPWGGWQSVLPATITAETPLVRVTGATSIAAEFAIIQTFSNAVQAAAVADLMIARFVTSVQALGACVQLLVSTPDFKELPGNTESLYTRVAGCVAAVCGLTQDLASAWGLPQLQQGMPTPNVKSEALQLIFISGERIHALVETHLTPPSARAKLKAYPVFTGPRLSVKTFKTVLSQPLVTRTYPRVPAALDEENVAQRATALRRLDKDLTGLQALPPVPYVQYKPGLATAWRHFRAMHVLQTYRHRQRPQYHLTATFRRVRRVSGFSWLRLQVLSVGHVTRHSGLGGINLNFNEWTLNGGCCVSPFTQLFAGDILGIATFLVSYGTRALSRCFTPAFIEVDELTLSIFIVYEPSNGLGLDASLTASQPFLTHRMYNWKYRT